MSTKQAAERLRRFAMDLIGIHGDGPYPTGAAERAVRLARAWLAEHAADDGEPVTPEWLESVDFTHGSCEKADCLHFSCLAITESVPGGGWRIHIGDWWEYLPDATRGKVRAIARQFDLKLQEAGK